MKIGILKADDVRPELVDEFGEYPTMFEQLLTKVDPTLSFITYDVQQMEYPQTLDEADAYLITGSRFSVYDEVAWIHRLGAFVQELFQAGKKIIGICFGHQLVAHFLGGKTAASPKGWGIGIYKITMTTAGQDFSPFHKDLQLIHSHRDQVEIPAVGSEILAGSEFCPVGMCKIGDQVLTVQGHPEFSKDYGRSLVSTREHLYDPKHYQQAMESLLVEQNDALLIAKWIVDFMK